MSDFKRLWKLYADAHGWMWLGLLLALAGLVANLALLTLSGWFISAMAVAGASASSINYFTPAAVIRGLAMLRTASRYGERVLTHEASLRVVAHLRVWLFRRLEPLTEVQLQAWHKGDLAQHLQQDLDRVDNWYLRILLPLLVAALAAALLSLWLLQYSAMLSVLLLAGWILGGALLPYWSLLRTAESSRLKVEIESQLRSQSLLWLQGMADWQFAGLAEQQRQHWLQQAESWLGTERQLIQAHNRQMALQLLLSLSVLWLGIGLLLNLHSLQALNGPQFVMLMLLLLGSFEVVAQTPAAWLLLAQTHASLKRLLHLADQPSAAPTFAEQQAETLPDAPMLATAALEFSYAAGTSLWPTLDLQFNAETRSLIYGPSGSGKTTLMQLLGGMLRPSAGQVRVQGLAQAQWNEANWRAQFAYLSQQAGLRNGSLRQNLLLARPEASETELWLACEQARLGDFIRSLPAGLDTWVGETGAKLSGGQARRVALARLFLREAKIWILDEPLEGLDAELAVELMQQIWQQSAGKTLIVISHQKLSGFDFDQRIELPVKSHPT